VDVNRLGRGEQIAGIAAVLLLIDMFLNWYSANLSGALSAAADKFGVDTSVNAWQSFSTTDLLIFLTVVAALVMVGMRVMARSASLPVSLPLVVVALGALTTLIVLWRIINQPGPNDFINVEYGAYIGLLLLIGLTYGAIQAGGGVDTMRAEAESVADRASSSVGGSGDGGTAATAGSAGASTVAEPPGPPPPAAPVAPATGIGDPAPPPPAPDPAPPSPGPDPSPAPAPEPEPPTPPSTAPEPPAPPREPAPPQPGDDPAGPTA
jgi:hypothetical protein